MPPVHFLKVIVQRGTIMTFMPAALGAGVPIMDPGVDIGIPGKLIPARSIMIADVIPISFILRVVLSRRARQPRAPHTVTRSRRNFKRVFQ
jgi:hypothetical protein